MISKDLMQRSSMGTMEREGNGYVFSTVQDTSERWRRHTSAHLTEIRQDAVRADNGAAASRYPRHPKRDGRICAKHASFRRVYR